MHNADAYVHDYRPRYDDRDNEKILLVAQQLGLKKNVALRLLTKAALSLPPDELVQRLIQANQN